jgi:crotonobetainyl-CoA:carnitine CoA-transferase CaiB-like acyl-CoA transferase
VSMLEASVSAMGWVVSNYLISGMLAEPMGDQNATAAPSGTFEAADGPLNIAANRQEQFVTLCQIINRPDLVDDERFRDREARKIHREALSRELNQALRARPAMEWEETLSAGGVPAARVLTVDQALGLEQLADRGFIAELPMPNGNPRRLRVVGNGAVFDGQPSVPVLPPPLLGEHNAELLPSEDELAADHVDQAATS